MPGYWPFYIFLFIYFHFFFLAITKSRLIKTHALKKERGQYLKANIQSRPLCLRSLSAEELWGRDWANIQSSWPKKLDLSHGQKQNFILCRVLLWAMTCNYWKVFSEWHGFKAWLGFVPVSNLGLVKYQTLARRRPRWRTISSDCTWPALVKIEKETVSLKTKRISRLRYLRWEWSKPGGGEQPSFPSATLTSKNLLPRFRHSDRTDCRTIEWTRMKVLPLWVCSSPLPLLRSFEKIDTFWPTAWSAVVFNFCVKGARHARQSESGRKLDWEIRKCKIFRKQVTYL